MKCLCGIILYFALLLRCATSGIIDAQISHSFATICNNHNGVLVPMPGSCSGFFICIDGFAIASSCGSFYHFNARTGLCDHPIKADCATNAHLIMDNPASASIYQTLPKPKFPVEVIADLNAGAICENRTTGTLLRKSGSCTQYYVCILQRPYIRTCPRLLHFNATSGLCQDPAIAQCIKPLKKLDQRESQINTKTPDNDIKAISFVNTFVSANTDSMNIDNICATSADGTIFSYPGDCRRFILCVNRHILTMFCPVGHHYSQQYERCEWPSIAKCAKVV
ncbi:probable chitinase 10 [Eurosta solidaginis]|uniref:probable chitinase 10 n=1 Tax=Eurosta solidaginis TaxID=178769 RepID=UPI003530B588